MPTGAVITRNGKAYDGGDALYNIDGTDYYGISACSYSETQEHQRNHSGRNTATSWSMGKVSPEASITMDMADSVALVKKYGNLRKIKPFFIIVSFVDEYNEIVVDRLCVKFTSNGRDISEAMNLKMSYPLFALTVEFQV